MDRNPYTKMIKKRKIKDKRGGSGKRRPHALAQERGERECLIGGREALNTTNSSEHMSNVIITQDHRYVSNHNYNLLS